MNWYYAKNGNQNGPLPTEDMKDRIAMGEISPTDLAWTEGMADWMPVGQIPELKVEAPVRQESFNPPPPVASAAPSPYQAPVSAPAPVSPVPMAPGQPVSQGLAIGSMICGILGLIACCVWQISGTLALVAVVLGFVALGKIKADPQRYRGKGMAVSGLVTGVLGVLLAIVMAVAEHSFRGLSPEEIQEKIIGIFPEAQQQEMREQLKKQQAPKTAP